MADRSVLCRALPALLALSLSFVSALLPVAAASAQPPPIQYAYDELGRLVAVVDQDGNAAVYVYDAVGNILSIQRIDAASLPGHVAISFVSPGRGKAGTVVSILGKGFGGSAAQNSVAFNGTPATVAQAAPNRIITVVPAGATTGPITVTAPLGSAVSPQPFRVVGAIAISPTTASLSVSGTQQFAATDGGAATTNVIWAVNGIVGGDPGVGTISSQGLYTAPATIASLQTVTASATSKDDVALSAAATVTLRPPVPVFLAAHAVGVQVADPSLRTLLAPGVGVQVADPGLRTLVAPGVGVQRDPGGAGLTVVAAEVGVSPPTPDAFAGVSPVSVSLEPLITSVSPASAVRGSVDLILAITGSGLAGAITIDFLLNNAPDTGITIVNLTAAPDGTQVAAQISIASTAVVGARVVQIRAPAGTTTAVGTGGNVLTVQ
jgi:YD repeat-containing protein